MEKTLKIIRENIKRERKKYGYTQEDMAQILNMSLSAYRKIEQGQRKLSLEHIISISNFLNIDLPTLFRMQTNEMDILNQNEKKRKEFLVELLKTFGIGTPPQKPYNDKDITALLSFIKAYGRSVPYCPDGIKNRIIYTGKYSDTFQKVDRLGEIYYNQLPEKQQFVKDLQILEKKLYEKCMEFYNHLKTQEQIALSGLYPEAEKLKKDISEKSDYLTELQEQIQAEEEHLAELKNEVFETNANNIWLQETLSRLEKDALQLAKKIGGTTSGGKQIIEYEKKCFLLEKKFDLLDQEYSNLYDKYEALTNRFEKEVRKEVHQIEQKIIAHRDKVIEDKTDAIIEAYHNLDADDLDDILYNLILFAQGFETLTQKYKTAPKEITKYVKDPSYLMINIDYSKLCDIGYISQYVKENIEWEREYRANTKYETES